MKSTINNAKLINVTNAASALSAIALCANVQGGARTFVRDQMEAVAASGIALLRSDVLVAYATGYRVMSKADAVAYFADDDAGKAARKADRSLTMAASQFYKYWFDGGAANKKATRASAKEEVTLNPWQQVLIDFITAHPRKAGEIAKALGLSVE